MIDLATRTGIGYRQLGKGPGLVILHGAMSSGYHHLELAEALADSFTCVLVDRRGRGLSAPYPEDFSIETEVDDLAAVLEATDAHLVFGVSSGAIIALQAALTLPAIHKLAFFEPPLFDDPAEPRTQLARLDRELAAGRTTDALVTGMRAGKLGPPVLNVIPRPLMARLTGLGLAAEEKKGPSSYVSMRALAPTLHQDFALIAEVSGDQARFRGVSCETLAMSGSKSPAYLRASVRSLAGLLPNVRHVELAGAGHAASWNTAVRGNPGPVADELRRFFQAP
jgi:pimeloyl-ACP methyl ester carboxylesterase